MDTKFLIEIHNKKNIPLTSLTLSLLNIGQQYSRFLNKNGVSLNGNDELLYIKDIKSGSIILELMPHIAYVLPLFKEFDTVYEFVKYLIKAFNYFLGNESEKPLEFDKKDLSQLHDGIGLIAKDHGSNINFIATNGSTINVTLSLDHLEANAIQNKLKKEIDHIENQKQVHLTRELLIWHQAKFSENNSTGDKAIIEKITKNPVKVIFDDPEIKHAMINTNHFGKPWQDLAYIVDVDIRYINDIPKLYKVLKLYPEETFDFDKE